MKKRESISLLAGLLFTFVVCADSPEVLGVKVDCADKQLCNFTVTLRHTDTGWDHYANRWEVLSPEGEMLATRTLFHPHVHEQPFTRSLSGVAIPAGIDKVMVRAHDSVHGYGTKSAEVILPSR